MPNTCATCKFWSEMIAQCLGGGPVEAMCLCRDSAKWQRYTVETQSCPQQVAGDPIDAPGMECP